MIKIEQLYITEDKRLRFTHYKFHFKQEFFSPQNVGKEIKEQLKLIDDEKNNLLCYLYLWNKTFLNAHLIKNGLTDVDTTIDYKYKQRFIKLLRERDENKIKFF